MRGRNLLLGISLSLIFLGPLSTQAGSLEGVVAQCRQLLATMSGWFQRSYTASEALERLHSYGVEKDIHSVPIEPHANGSFFKMVSYLAYLREGEVSFFYWDAKSQEITHESATRMVQKYLDPAKVIFVGSIEVRGKQYPTIDSISLSDRGYQPKSAMQPLEKGAPRQPYLEKLLAILSSAIGSRNSELKLYAEGSRVIFRQSKGNVQIP